MSKTPSPSESPSITVIVELILASSKLVSGACVAVMVAVPTPVIVTTAPLIVATAELLDV